MTKKLEVLCGKLWIFFCCWSGSKSRFGFGRSLFRVSPTLGRIFFAWPICSPGKSVSRKWSFCRFENFARKSIAKWESLFRWIESRKRQIVFAGNMPVIFMNCCPQNKKADEKSRHPKKWTAAFYKMYWG